MTITLPSRHLGSALLALLLGTSVVATPYQVFAETSLTDIGAQMTGVSVDGGDQPADGDSAANEAPNTPTNDAETSSITSAPDTAVQDSDIRTRIRGIFSEIEGLQAVTVTVNQGVVTLAGETANEKKAQQAINLSSRIANVVTVNDEIERTLDVQDNVSTVYQSLITRSKQLLKALPLVFIGILLFGIVALLGSQLAKQQRLWQRVTPNPFVAELLAQTVKVIFIILGLILALSLIGAETILGTLLGGAGVIGIAVGFAVKDTIENYIASLMLSIRQPFRARDQVVINGQEGIVVRLTSRATILMTLDGNQLRIPNAEVFKGTILNYTKNPERRFTFELGVDANDDPIAAIKVGLDAINQLDFVLSTPKAIAVINEVGDSNIVLEFQVWVDQSQTDFAKARSIAIRETKHALEDTGFSLPEPIYRLRFSHKLEQALMHLPNGDAPAKVTPIPSDTASENDKEKTEAKARAKQILEGCDTSDVLDAKPDAKLLAKVEQEIAENTDTPDLLDSRSPQE